MKSYLLYLAMILLVLCMPFRGSENEIHWLWADRPWAPLSLISMALVSIAIYLY